MVAEHLNREKRAADWPNNRMDRIPGGVDPRDFVGKEFERVENAGDNNNPGLAENLERLVLRRQSNPVEMNREPGDENGEVKINPRKAGEAESDAQEVESIHAANI